MQTTHTTAPAAVVRRYRFRPNWWVTLATLLAIAGMIKLGLWQAGKAEEKLALQASYDNWHKQPPVSLSARLLAAAEAASLHYARVRVAGTYETGEQVLLDNQVDAQGRAGYHVITPLRIAGGETRVLVNRGWMPLGKDRSALPQITTPQAAVEVSGLAVVPSTKTFVLAQPESLAALQQSWRQGGLSVWQVLDMGRYAQAVPYPLQPLVIRLEADSGAGGFVRDWPRPDARVEKHLGYAYQWYGMAAALLVFYGVVNFKKTTATDPDQTEKEVA